MADVDAAVESLALPPELLAAISAPAGGRVTLVIGAGASFESPTAIPLAGRCSEDAYRRLVADEILEADRCKKPWDLTAVADAVHEATGGQAALVERLPLSKFRKAEPNSGYLLAAALLREGAIASVLSLNFDRAMENALMAVGAADDVVVIRGPEDGATFGSNNVVYLHRTVDHLPDEWILRSDSLTTAWSDAWEEAVTQRTLTTQFVVFAGLGSEAKVLTETAKKLKTMLGHSVSAIQVDPTPFGPSEFSAALEIAEDAYLEIGWCDFMARLGNRVLIEHIAALRKSFAAAEQDRDGNFESADILRQLDAMGLVAVGGLRARWMLSPGPYETARNWLPTYVAQILLGLVSMASITDLDVVLCDDGVVEFWSSGELISSWGVVCSAGRWKWGSVEARVQEYPSRWRNRRVPVENVMVSGAAGVPSREMTPPQSIVGSSDPAHIIPDSTTMSFHSFEQLDSDEDRLREVFKVGR